MNDPQKPPEPTEEEREAEEVEEVAEFFTKIGKDDSPTSDAEAPPP